MKDFTSVSGFEKGMIVEGVEGPGEAFLDICMYILDIYILSIIAVATVASKNEASLPQT